MFTPNNAKEGAYYTAKTQYQKFETNIPKKGIAPLFLGIHKLKFLCSVLTGTQHDSFYLTY
jgi:hypothetical protein